MAGKQRQGSVSVGALVPVSLVALSSLAPVVGSDLGHGPTRLLLAGLAVLTLYAAVTGHRGGTQLGLGLTGTVAACSLLPWQLAWWPLPGLVGVAVYLLARTLTGDQTDTHRTGIRLGRVSAEEIWMVAGVVLTSASVLLVFSRAAPPRIGAGASFLTTMTPWSLVIAGLAFGLLNALVEELLFRGAVLHHLGNALGKWTAVLVQALAFGMLHLNGYPYGPVGVGLAFVYGLLLGAMRLRSGGLLAPWIAHVLTDLVIFGLIVSTAT
ncbi:CPBP family intramembrane glutamic endopeptidase [Nocardioides gansuensis]|uniref:CPBP family intramembrane glutamic endopeptidase n=1 Tax=Nocardioides gansuensis TaxID=2138300 RepID=UPI001403D0F9|nr:CPBP family intramembrane glutamic endopeptidase [Nocardioides gansuensis]